MLNEVDCKFDDARLHLLLVLSWYYIRKDLNTRLCQKCYDFANSEIVVCPEASHLWGSSSHVNAILALIWVLFSRFESVCARKLVYCSLFHNAVWSTSVTTVLVTKRWNGAIFFLLVWKFRLLSVILLQLNRKHEKLIVEDWNVDQALTVLRLSSTFKRVERRLAVLLFILKDPVYDFVAFAHLNHLY